MRAHGGAIISCSLALSALAVGLAPGCASRTASPPVDNSLDRLLADASAPATIDSPPAPDPRRSVLEERMDATVLALEQALRAGPRADAPGPGQSPEPQEPPAAPGDDSGNAPGESDGIGGSTGSGNVEAFPAASPPDPVPLTDLPPHRLAEALAQVLWTDADQADDPFARAVTLAFLECHFDLPAPDAAGMGGAATDLYRRLTPGQRESLSAMRHLAHETLRGEARSGETGPVADVLDGMVFSLWDRDPVRIGRVALCQEVRRYGDFEPLESSRFLAGETAEMVVYVEMDRFTNVPEGAGWKVDLSLEINVFTESGRTLVWRMAQTPYTLTSSRRLHDVFLPAIVELPPTLGAGRYTLKAIVRDRSDGSADERIVPITLVAEPRLR